MSENVRVGEKNICVLMGECVRGGSVCEGLSVRVCSPPVCESPTGGAMKDGRGRDKVVAFFASRPPTGLDRWHQFIACRRRLTKEYFNVHLTNLTEKEKGHL